MSVFRVSLVSTVIQPLVCRQPKYLSKRLFSTAIVRSRQIQSLWPSKRLEMSPHSTAGIPGGLSGVGFVTTNDIHTNGIHTQSIETPATEQDVEGAEGPVVETEFLVVGCGPAGAGLACFLASHGECGLGDPLDINYSTTVD